MQAYMKSAMPYLGVRVPEVRRLVRLAERAEPLADEAAVRSAVTELWDTATHREHRYSATELLNTRSAHRSITAGRLDLIQRLIVEGAWWDHVDELSRRVGEILLGWPAGTRPRLLCWATGENHWLRRSSIICQLGFRDRIDLDLLTHAIDASAGEPDFFLRKAIGWALRELARTDPDWVRAFVSARTLSPLSVREALKHL